MDTDQNAIFFQKTKQLSAEEIKELRKSAWKLFAKVYHADLSMHLGCQFSTDLCLNHNLLRANYTTFSKAAPNDAYTCFMLVQSSLSVVGGYEKDIRKLETACAEFRTTADGILDGLGIRVMQRTSNNVAKPMPG